MSLAIDVDRVTHVLLADGWHEVTDVSFTLDAYEFVWYPAGRQGSSPKRDIMHGGGNDGVCAAGFSFKTAEGDYIQGPLTAILAVRTSPVDA
jgi:hypothetical protein